MRSEWALAPIRLVLAAGGAAILWFAQDQLETFQADQAASGEFDTLRWLLVVGLGVAAGLVFGLAIRPPIPWTGYRWGRVFLLSLPPLLLLAHFVFLSGYAVDRDYGLPEIFLRTTPFHESQAQFALMVMLGVGIASGVTGRRRREPREEERPWETRPLPAGEPTLEHPRPAPPFERPVAPPPPPQRVEDEEERPFF
jgi:hypothetical protein